MQKFTYIIHKDFAMHFGPAGRLANLARLYPDSTATIEMGSRVANVSKPMAVASMGLRKEDRVVVTVNGPSEVELADVLFHYFEDFL